MEKEKKPGKYADKSAKGFWRGLGKGVLGIIGDLLGEVLIGCLAFVIGVGIFMLLGKEHLILQMDTGWLVSLGGLVIIAVVVLVGAIVNHVKKKMNRKPSP